ncbi:phage antirepressor N-terminal domain-containing protein [Testudinibacter sp. P80/BLE/0925]
MKILKAPFLGTEISIVDYDGKPYVLMKNIAENIGLQWRAQRKRILRHEVLSKGVIMMDTPSNGGVQKTLLLPLHYLNGWLFGIDVKRVNAELHDKLIRYQVECYEVLWDYWTTGIASRDRIKQRLAELAEREKESAKNGSAAGKALNQRKQEKSAIAREAAKLKQFDLFLDI